MHGGGVTRRSLPASEFSGSYRVEGEMNRVVAHALSQQPFDVIVIGSGINGAGIARDAALRGLRGAAGR